MHEHEARWLRAGLLTFLFGLSLTLESAVKASPGDTLYVQDKSVNVYHAPSADAPVVMRLDRGRKLKEFRRQGSWVKVIVYGEIGKEGWVEQSRLGPDPAGGTSVESQEPEEDAIVGAIGTPKPKAGSLLHTFVLKYAGIAEDVAGSCRYITESGATGRIKLQRFERKAYQVEAKAIRCKIKSSGGRTRLSVKMWADGELAVSRSLNSRGTLTIESPWDWK